MDEKTLKVEKIFSGRVFDITKEEVALENGQKTFREVAWHKGGACIAAFDSEDNIYFVRQFRYPFKEELLEIPAGKLEEGEDPKSCALRELEEETGLIAKDAELLSVIYATPAYCSEKAYIYIANGVKQGKQKLDPGEFLDVVKIPFKKALQMVLDDKIADSKTQIAVLKSALLRKK